jgi:hypothetical protein
MDSELSEEVFAGHEIYVRGINSGYNSGNNRQMEENSLEEL